MRAQTLAQLASSLDRPRAAFSSEPGARDVARKGRGEQAIAERVGLPGDLRVPQPGAHEDGPRGRDLVARQLPFLQLLFAEHARVLELGPEKAIVRLRLGALGEVAHELVAP